MQVNLNFEQALEALKQGKNISRETWTDRWLFLGKGITAYITEGSSVVISATIVMYSADAGFQILSGLSISPTDLLAEDWTAF